MQGLPNIIGHESIIEHLQNAIQMNKISHAYIFHGEEGMGKKLLAGAFAKTLQCEERGIIPCNQCTSCMQFNTENHPDIIRVTHEKVSIGVDDIRLQVNGDIYVKPYRSPYKIYMIDDAEKLTESAQNALLKTMEEPPEYAILLLLVNNINSLLQTILSRCVVLNLKPVDKPKLKEFLMTEHKVPDYMADMAADFSGGNVGKAMKYAFSEDFERLKEDVLHILKYIDAMELHEVVSGLKTITGNKGSIEDNIDLMILWYRDVLMLKATNDPDLLLYKNEYQYIKKQANIISYEGLETIIKAMEKAKVRLKANVNVDIAIELMLLTIKENSNG
ncbi:DNA polymerase III subunit delta' [Mobilitalea sibirica]|uniref:DNA polymerase III subunit delta n=1 Tax=Mobilitalea sibirica TaxID=1462919 RepID=A0A8J7HCC3_9FIRM|nr:DNA polymerase III subunit delta' [Mobilitalea sibirica]MBH1941921.1 DNA polymerase III subunit delta' [Mobilitalea sibirica]